MADPRFVLVVDDDKDIRSLLIDLLEGDGYRAKAVGTGAGTVAVGCPFCMTMLSDGVNTVAPGGAEVVDVATVLLRSIKPEPAAP